MTRINTSNVTSNDQKNSLGHPKGMNLINTLIHVSSLCVKKKRRLPTQILIFGTTMFSSKRTQFTKVVYNLKQQVSTSKSVIP